ncbi:MAG: altronate dehydratase family protein [Chitinophagales bacterium]
MNKVVLKVHPKDNIIVALKDLKAGEVISFEGEKYELLEDIPTKHKFSQQDFAQGDEIVMYGVLVGKATRPIHKGTRISTENVKHSAHDFEVGKRNTDWEKPDVSNFANQTFNGFHRADGKVGTMNYWLVIPLVFCENRNIKVIQEAMTDQLGYISNKDFTMDVRRLVELYREGAEQQEILAEKITKTQLELKENRIFKNVDGIKFLTHEGGCGGIRQDSETLCELFAGYLTHPNVAGATVLSLGCQNAQIPILQKAIEKRDSHFTKPLFFLEQQNSASERDFIEEAIKKTFVGLIEANKIQRKPAPLSQLTIGLECGGSDGFSGISANPTLGYTSDLLVTLGGKAILSEFPELNGVEQELINRCMNDRLAEKFSHIMRTYAQRAEAVGSGFDMNPSPGNIKDGLITDAMKSAGAAKKGGTSPVVDVLDYTEPATQSGLSLLCTPGNDVESTTGLAGSGANIILFTTGLGTPTGNPISPTIKVSSNNKLAEKMADIIDFNTGTIITGEDSIETKGNALLEYIIQVASGEAIPNAVRLGQDDFIPWKRGISL